MTSTPITVKGYINPLPRTADENLARVIISTSETDYYVVPRGAGIDLDDHLSASVEAIGTVTEKDELLYLHVRKYTLTDVFENDWYDDKE